MINPEDLESIDFIDFKELLEVVIFITSKKGTLVSNFFYYYVSSVSWEINFIILSLIKSFNSEQICYADLSVSPSTEKDTDAWAISFMWSCLNFYSSI